MDASERLVAAMPAVEEVHRRRILPWQLERRWLDIRRPHRPDGLPAYLCCELAESAEDACHFGYWAAEIEHEYQSWFLRIWAAEPPARAEVPKMEERRSFETMIHDGVCDAGPVWISLYVEGADLNELRRAGVELSWAAARCVHAAARAPLAALHARKVVHGALSPSRIRLALSQEPHRSRAMIAPLRFCLPLCRRGDAAAEGRDLAELAAAVCALTRHPDPQIEALLRDPSPHALAVLTDLLLERGAPVDELLTDRLRGSEAAAAALAIEPHADTDVIQAELAAMWRRVVELCVLMR